MPKSVFLAPRTSITQIFLPETLATMGQQRIIENARPLAEALATLAVDGLACQVVMVDGQLVHPSASLPTTWREVRLRTPAGMVTLAAGTNVVVTVFGNANDVLLETRDRIARALAPLT